MKNKLLTTGQVAKMFDISYRTVSRWCDFEGLPFYSKKGALVIERPKYARRWIKLEMLRDWLTVQSYIIWVLTKDQADRIRRFISQGVVE